jgi:hypothetical protein
LFTVKWKYLAALEFHLVRPKDIKMDMRLVRIANNQQFNIDKGIHESECTRKTGTDYEAFDTYLAKPDEAFYTQSFHKMKVAAMRIQS